MPSSTSAPSQPRSQRRVLSAPAFTGDCAGSPPASTPSSSFSCGTTPKNYSPQQRPTVTRRALTEEQLCRIHSLPGNLHCADCGRSDEKPGWASVSHGTVVCIACCGVHRSLGVVKSFIKSLTLDSWTEAQVTNMMVGGNRKLADYFRRCGVDTYCSNHSLASTKKGLVRMHIAEKYSSTAAKHYRLCIISARNGVSPPDEPPKHKLLTCSSSPNLLHAAMSQRSMLANVAIGKLPAKDLRVPHNSNPDDSSDPDDESERGKSKTCGRQPGPEAAGGPRKQRGMEEVDTLCTEPLSPSVLTKRRKGPAQEERCKSRYPGLLVDTEPATLTSTCSKICAALYDTLRLTVSKCIDDDNAKDGAWGQNTPFHCLAREVERAAVIGHR